MKEAIKNFITEKALEVFLKKGYEEANMDEIANESGITKPTLYKYFPSKMDLFLGVINFINKRIDEQLFSVLKTDKGYEERIKDFLEKNLEFAMSHKRFVKIAIFDSASPFFKDKQKRNKYFEEFFKIKKRRRSVIKDFLIEGQNNGVLRNDIDSDTMTIFLMGSIKEFFFEIIMSKDELDINLLKENLYKILESGLFRRNNEK